MPSPSCATCRTAPRARCAASAASMVGAVVPSFDYALYARTTSALQRGWTSAATRWCWPSTTTTWPPNCASPSSWCSTASTPSCSSGLDHDPALFALLEDYGRPYVLTWGVDPMRRHPSIGFDNRAATLRDRRATCSAWATGASACSARRPTATTAPASAARACAPRWPRPAWRSTSDCVAVRADRARARPRGDGRGCWRCPRRAPDGGGRHQRRVRRRRDAGLPQGRRAHAGATMSITGVDNTDLGATQTPRADQHRARRSSRSAAPPPTSWSRGSRDRPCEAFQRLPFELVRARQHRAAPPG